jgi:hypothetical protein
MINRHMSTDDTRTAPGRPLFVAKHYAAISYAMRLGRCPRECAVAARHATTTKRHTHSLLAEALPPSTWRTPSLPSPLPTGKARCCSPIRRLVGRREQEWLVCTCDGTQLGSRAMQGNKAERHVVPATRRSHSSRPQRWDANVEACMRQAGPNQLRSRLGGRSRADLCSVCVARSPLAAMAQQP